MLSDMIIMCLGLGFPGGLSHHHLPHIKQEFDRPPGLISHHQGGEDTKHDSPKKKVPVCIAYTYTASLGEPFHFDPASQAPAL